MTTGGGEASTVWNSILLVLLGWLLGLLGPVIVDAIRRRYRNEEIRTAVLSELSEARFRLAGVVYVLESRFGTYNRELLEWILPLLESYRGPNPSKQIVELMRRQLALSDAKLAEIAQAQKVGPEGGLEVNKYRLPYIDSRVGDLGLFDEESRASILDVRSNIDLFNEQVDEARFYFKLTYESGISEENHRRATLGAEKSYQNLSIRAREIIDRINRLLPVAGGTRSNNRLDRPG